MPARPLVKIIQGQLRGVTKKSVNGKQYAAFKGIPYAKPPIGELRFRDPVPAEPWSHVMDTANFGTSCAQYDAKLNRAIGSDDCLYLNVYTSSNPSCNDSPPKPVMFWIHGGLFSYGSGDDTLFGPDYIVEKGVLLVTINYRLNVFGFLNLEDEETTGNQGLKDQVMALKWVQENITNFGGDPNNVTIFGVSAGSTCVHYLTLSPLAEGLYHKAISQSGFVLNPWSRVQRSPKIDALELVATLGEKIQNSKILVEFLRSIDAHKLSEADAKLAYKMKYKRVRPFAPSVDDKSKNPFLSVPATIAAQSGVKVPYMFGYTSHEALIYLAGMTDQRLKAVDRQIETILAPEVIKFLQNKSLTPAELKKIYFGDKAISRNTIFNLLELLSDIHMNCGFYEVTEIQKSVGKCPTYLYHFLYDNGQSRLKKLLGLNTIPGTTHTDELSYIFRSKHLQLRGEPEPGSMDHLMTQRVTQMWTNFAKTGNPTPTVTDTVPVIWKPVAADEELQHLNIDEVLQMESMINVNKRFLKNNAN